MPRRKLDNWLKTYMVYSQHSEAPDAFHFWAGVSAIAGALRARVWMDQGYFRWVPNFYIVFVAPPGIVSKSTTMGISMRLLREVEGVRFGPDTATWQAFVQSMSSAKTYFDLPDGTLDVMSAITIQSSEFGTFLNPADREMVDMLVSLWDGQRGTWSKVTKTQGNDEIENPWVNIIGATTPAWIQGHFPEYMIGGGFTSRCIFVYAERKRQLVAYPGDYVSADDRDLKRNLIHDLGIIANEMVGNFVLSPEAREWGVEWYINHSRKLETTTPDDRIAGFYARKQTHMHKLAMILAASESNELVIQKEHLIHADQIITSTEGVLPKVFSQISAPEARATNRIAGAVGRLRTVPRDQLYRSLMQQMSFTEFEAGVKGALASGLIRLRQEGNVVHLVATQELPDAKSPDGETRTG